MKTQLLKLSLIVTTRGTQIRASINADAVDRYAEAMQEAGNKFPAIVVFHDGSEYILADGFHRVMAATRNGFKDIETEVRKGTKSDALKYALGANSTHGQPRTGADKRRSVELALIEWPKVSDREIAKICAVGNQLVGDVRRDLAATCVNHTPESRVGGDGKTYKIPARKSKPESKPDVSLVEEPEVDRVAFQQQEAREAFKGLEIPTDNSARNNAISDFEVLFSEHIKELNTESDLRAFKLTVQVGLKKIEEKLKAVRLNPSASKS